MAELTLHAMLADRAALRPAKAAFLFGGETLSYRELDARGRRIATGLIAAGVQPGDRVAYIGRNSAAFYEIVFGASRVGAVLMPVNRRLADDEIGFILNDGRVRFLFAERAFCDQLAAAGVALDLAVPLDALGIGDDYARWRDALPQFDGDLATDREAIAMQLYTSGTTGKPKGAMLSHHSILGLRADVPAALQPAWNSWSEDDVSILPLPLFHIGTAVWGLIGLYHGATSVIQPEFDAGDYIEAVETHRVTRLCLVPSALKLIIEHPRAAAANFSSVAYTFYGASPIALTLLKACIERIGGGFVQIYGMTETSGAIAGLPPEDHDVAGNRRMLSAGKAYPGVEIEIHDPDGRSLAEGDIGEIVIRSPANMVGYHGRPGATAQAVDARGWLRTGDAGFLEDGYVFIHDRIKEMIISGGENVYPAEVEAVLGDHPAVADVAVIGIPDQTWGEAVKAVVVLREGAQCDAREIIAWARGRIAGYKAPKSVDFATSLPRNPSGKLLRKDLREPYWAALGRRVN